MAHIDGTGRIVPDTKNKEPIEGWAILVHGRTVRDQIFSDEDTARAFARMNHHATSEVVPVVVTGDYVERR